MDNPKVSDDGYEPLILAFACNWCSYPAADSAGLSRMQYPPNFRILRVMCGGRVNPGFILHALELGADGILYSCCHEQDCHYMFGAKQAVKNFETALELVKLAGFDANRIRFEQISAAEATKWVRVMHEMLEQIKALGASPVKKNLQALKAFGAKVEGEVKESSQ